MGTTTGSTGDDTLNATSGDDTLIGLDGTDVAVFGGNMADYTITSAGPWVLVTDTNTNDGDDGTEYLHSIEVLRFADGDLDLSLTNDEFQVNTVTTGDQGQASIIGLADGGFLMVWQDGSGQDGDQSGIQAQRYDAAGEPVGDEFQVNNGNLSQQTLPQVTQLTGGNVVFTWSSTGIDGTERGIAARIFDSSGNPVTEDFTVDLTDTLSGFPTAGRAQVEALAAGGFVVVFEDNFQQIDLGGSTTVGGDLFAQRFDATGATVGTAVQVNTFTTNAQSVTDIQALADGGFLVAISDGFFQADGQDGSGSGVFVRRFDANGNPVKFDPGQADTSEVQIDTATGGTQTNGKIAELSNGEFVITWHSGDFFTASDGGPQDGSDADVFAQVYNANGSVAVAKFRVNNFGDPAIDFGPENWAQVAALSGGGFVVVWEELLSGDTRLVARRFDNSGNALGDEFQVNTFITGDQAFAEVAALADGGFVVTWQSEDPLGDQDQDGSFGGIFAQRFDAEGRHFGFATVTGSVNADTLRGGGSDEILDGDAGNDTLDGGADNDTVSGGDGKDSLSGSAGIDTLFGDAGADILDGGAGNDSLVGGTDADTLFGGDDNDNLAGGDQGDTLSGGAGNDSLLGDGGDDIFLADEAGDDWIDSGLGFDTLEYDPSADPPGAGPLAGTGVTVDLLAGTATDTMGGTDSVFGIEAVGGTAFDDSLTGDHIANTIDGRDGDDTVTGNGGDDSLIGGAGADVAVFAGNRGDYKIHNTNSAIEVEDLFIGIDGADGEDRVAGVETLRFSDGDVTVATGTAEFQVNQFTTNGQTEPDAATLTGGNVVVVWSSGGTSGTQDGSFRGVFGRLYDTDGDPLGDEFQINTETNSEQFLPSVTELANGGFVVAWTSINQDGFGNGVFGQVYDASGNTVGGEFQLNTTTTSAQQDPDIAALPGPGGGFVAVWESDAQDGDSLGVVVQRFDNVGAKIGGETVANTFTTGSQSDPVVAVNSTGEFLVAWQSQDQDGSSTGIYAQAFSAAGAKVGGEIAVNQITFNSQLEPAVAALADGTFVVAFTHFASDGSGAAIVTRRFDASGSALGNEVIVNTYTDNNQDTPAIEALADGGYMVSWSSFFQPGDDSREGVFAQRFDAAGNRVGGEFLVNTFTNDEQTASTLAAQADGRVFAFWQSGRNFGPTQDGDDEGIFG